MDEHLQMLIESIAKAKNEISKVIIGQEKVVEQALIAIICGQHVLIEGVPGIAKTLLVRTISHILGSPFGRIQFTPDLMPSDITGTNVFNFKENNFNLIKGPIFTTFLLADEINRSPAKTQSALLQAMQERKVTIDNETYDLSKNFTVFATQNPIEHEGTYSLPEAQKDRFMLKIFMDYPTSEDEMQLALKMLENNSPENVLESGEVQEILSEKDILKLREFLKYVIVKNEILKYLVDIVRKTRNYEAILVGAGPRATQSLILAVRALAVLDGRDFVVPDDIKNIASAVLSHRLILRPEYEIEGLTMNEVIQDILKEITVPK
ncbi:MAG: MoxR family ATPase [Candidatus Cloacimonetes bacterium]|nr:MoxR family ATPase [Candidatus Cloacimonadota bacterium]